MDERKYEISASLLRELHEKLQDIHNPKITVGYFDRSDVGFPRFLIDDMVGRHSKMASDLLVKLGEETGQF